MPVPLEYGNDMEGGAGDVGAEGPTHKEQSAEGARRREQRRGQTGCRQDGGATEGKDAQAGMPVPLEYWRMTRGGSCLGISSLFAHAR
jgi:hypothetical protein